MPSDSVAGFLDRAQVNRILFPEQVEQLVRQPDLPHSDLSALCDYLLSRKVMTRFQAAAILEGRGDELTLAGYALVDDLGPCRGGRAYRSLHPSLRTPLVVRRIDPSWLDPNDTVHGYLNRAKTFGTLNHPNVVPLLDAGLATDIYLVIDPPADAANLEELSKEVGGAMPGFLAAEYGRAVAAALAALHARGGFHGEVRPANLIVSPLVSKINADGVEKRRPGPNAEVRLMDVGLVPLRPPASEYPFELDVLSYLPPERLGSGVPEPAGDLYGLGACLYFLLTGRAPFEATGAAGLTERIGSAEPVSLSVLRPDLPPEMVALVARLMHKRVEARPATAAELEDGLAVFCRSGSKLPHVISPAPLVVPETNGQIVPEGSLPVVLIPEPEDVPAAESAEAAEEGGAAEAADFWGGGSEALAEVQDGAEKAPRKREMSDEEKKRSRRLLIFGALLHLTGVGLLVLLLTQGCDGGPKSRNEPAPVNKDRDKDQPGPAKKPRKQNSMS